MLCSRIVCQIKYKPKTYKSTINLNSDNIKKGYLININDSAVFLSKKPLPLNFNIPYTETASTINYSSISSISLKRKGSVGRGALFGALSGFALGTIIAVADGDDPYIPPEQDFFGIGNAFRLNTGEKIFVYGLSSATSGVLIGLVVGALTKKKFTINGQKEGLKRMRTKLTPTTNYTN